MMVLATALLGLSSYVLAQVDTSQPCSQQPAGYGPVPSPNTDTAFAKNAAFAAAANNAKTPALYQRTFVNLNGSEIADDTNVYMGFYEMKSYNPADCTAICDKTSGCVGTNLYFERSPALLPAAACPNPAGITLIKCALWGSPVSADKATNYGQWREQFHILIAGSNGYFKLPSQCCAAVQSAWNGQQYALPTGANWQGWMSSVAGKFTSASWPSSATAGPTGY